MTEAVNVTAALAEKAAALRFQHLTPQARTVAKQCLLDFLGVTLSGMDEPLSDILSEIAEEDGGRAEATVIGRGMRTSLSNAALINGAMSHALDYDDVNLTMGGHPTVPVAPAALALAESRKMSGRDLITAIVAGIEMECGWASWWARATTTRAGTTPAPWVPSARRRPAPTCWASTSSARARPWASPAPRPRA